MRLVNAVGAALLGAATVTSIGLAWLFWPARPDHAVALTPDGTCVLLDVSRDGRRMGWRDAAPWSAAHPDVVFPEACDASETPCPRGFVCTTDQQCVPSPVPSPALWQACVDRGFGTDRRIGAHAGWEQPGASVGVLGAFARARSAGDGAAPVTAWRTGDRAEQIWRYEVAPDGRVRPLVGFQSDMPFGMLLLGTPLFAGSFVVLLVLALGRGGRR
jgi:hypothetical protein